MSGRARAIVPRRVDIAPKAKYERDVPPAIAGELIRYVRFDESDAERVLALLPILAPHFRDIAEEFYDRTRDFEAAHAVFRDEAQIERLKTSLVDWMRRLFSGKYDDGFFAHAERVGLVHVRVGLPHRYIYAATSVLRRSFAARVEGAGPSLQANLQSLDVLLDLSLAVMLESYFGETIQHAQRAERAHIERLHASREHRHLAAIEGAGLAIIGVDEAGKVALVNAAVETRTNRDREALVGRVPFEDLFAVEDREGLGKIVARLLVGGEARATLGAAALESASGRSHNMRWEIRRIDAVEGLRLVMVGHDTGLEARLEAQARRNERLAAIGTLAAGLAHEIRNPLNGALLNLTILDREIDKGVADRAALSEAARFVRSEIVRLSQLTNEFLDFARPHSLASASVDLGALAARVQQVVTDDAEKARVEVSLDVPRHPVFVTGDAGKLEQVGINLARNAIEAMASGGGRLVLRVRRKPEAGLLEVEDDGPGVPHDAPIFDAFFTTKPTGTGLGLAIAQRIVAAHGGALSFTSLGGKTTFQVTIPNAGPESIRRSS